MDHGNAMNRVSFILLLVSVLGSRAISVSNASYASNKSDDATRNDVEQPRANIASGESYIGKDPFVETATVPQPDDQDPSESSETVVYNRFEKPASNEGKNTASDEEEDPEGPPEHAIPYSEHEETRNVPTRPKYTAPGEWAKPPRGEQRVNPDFVPSKVYAQVRKTHTLRRLPRRKAIENAESDEEKENAARLREVVKNTKVNTVYTEEGYEDSAYDHAGHIRDADFREGYARKLRDHLDLRKKSENGDFDYEENETKQRNDEKVRPDEFKDFDEDYRDGYEQTDTERASVTDDVRGDEKWKEWIDPKEIAEEGREELQEDLEKEAEEIEKGAVEIDKLEKVETTTTTTEALTESRRSDDHDRTRDLRWRRARGRARPSATTRNSRPREDLEKLGATYNLENSTTDTLDRARESVTFDGGSDKDSSRSYEYEVDGNSSPNFDSVGAEKFEENPTTISYSQLLWEYFKKQENQLSTTEAPRALEPTTLNSNVVQGSLPLDNVNRIVAYPVYLQGATTSYPILESVISSSRPILPIVPIGRKLIHPEHPKDNVQSSLSIPLGAANANQAWHPIGTNVLSTTETTPYVEIHPNGQNLVSDEESLKNLNDPALFNSAAQRKPRYKITIRHKPNKPSEYSVLPSQQPATSDPLIEPMTENTPPDPVSINENYVKMLTHLQNERNAKSHYHPNGVRQSSNFPLSSSGKKELEDLTRLRPPLPQKLSHYYYDLAPPRVHPEIDAAPSDWRPFPVHQRPPRLIHSVPRKASTQAGDSRQRHAKQASRVQPRHPSDRKRNVPPAFDALLGNDPVRQIDGTDYANRYRSRRARTVPRPFRQPYTVDGAHGVRAKTRERRSARRGRAGGDESSSYAKGSIANNGTSNRGEIERPAKRRPPPAIERNCGQKVTRGVEVGPVPDTSSAKQPAEKKSRSCGEGPRAAERESSAVVVGDGNEGRLGDIDGDSGPFRYDGSGESVGNVESATAGDGREMESKGVEDRGISSNLGADARDGVNLGKGNATDGVVESVMEDELEEFEEWSNLEESKENRGENGSGIVESVRKKGDVGKVEWNVKEFQGDGKFYGLEELKRDGVKENTESWRTRRNVEDVESDRPKQHDGLLDEAPRIAEDVIRKEIDARFNENEGKEEGQEDREKMVEVEVPEFDYVEEVIEDEEDRVEENVATTEQSLDLRKYPFYENEKLPMASALKYATDPNRLPRKSHGGMEFYNSRDAYKHCDEVEPNLEVAPENEEPVAEKGPNENPPRLQGLGDKLDCFKAKYFDNDPFDNPLFFEKEVEHPTAPPRLDTMGFASRIMILPKENDDFAIQRVSKRPENYRQPRKPISVRLQKTRRIRYKNYPRTRTGTRTRPRKGPPVYRLQVPQVKNTSTSKKSQNPVKSPVASASEVSSFYMPYQNQVYEDVMGTIKNMASLYQVHEVTTTLAPEETTVMPDIDDDVKTNSSTSSTSYGTRDKGKVQIDIMDRPNDVDINIKGAARPKNHNRYRPVYRRTRRPSRNKPRIQLMQSPVVAVRTFKHRPRVRVYKRDLSDVNEGRQAKWTQTSEEFDSTENRGEVADNFANVKRSQSYTVKNNPIAKSVKEPSVQKNSTTKRKTKVLKSVRRIGTVDSDEDQKRDKSGKVVYTIKDRIRYSKPKNELRRVGKFVNETKVEEDERRREPKYNSIAKKNSANSLSSTVEGSLPSSIATTNLSEMTTTTENVNEGNDPGLKDESKEVRYIVDETRNENVAATTVSGDSKQVATEQPKEGTTNKTEGVYAVYETVNEGETITTTTTTTTTTTQRPQSATPSEFFSLKSFLEIDPPGYMELSSDDFKRSFFSNDNSTDNDNVTTNLDSLHTNRTENRTEKDAGRLTNFGPPYFSEEEEEQETRTKVESSTESSEESSATRSKENESEEDRTFFSYTSRPYSPAETYEDPKYSDLGPRVNKPAFFHPPFSKYRKSRSRDSVEEVVESDERKEEYVFPWHKDKEDQRRRRRGRPRGKSTGEYEYPWERRERLAREEKLRKEERRKRLGKGFDDDDDDDDEQAEETYVSKQLRNPYPRGRYRYWSRKDRDATDDNISDNTENVSEYQPTMKYSSRYNSKSSKLPLTDKQTKPRRGSVEEISKSIKKALEGDSGEKAAPKRKEDDDGSWEKEKSFSYRPRSISRGIVPEDVTLAPTRRSGKRGKLKASDSRNATSENGNSSEARNSLDDSESRTATVKSNAREAGNSTNQSNSTRQSSKKRRRPPKSTVSIVENTTKMTITEANRARRKQKSTSTTPKTIASATSAFRVIRRRNPKSLKDAKKNEGIKAKDKSSNDVDSAFGMSKSGTVEHRSRGRKRNRTSETVNELAKNEEERDLSSNSSRKREHSEKVNDERERNPRNETVEKKSLDDESDRDEETTDSKQTYPTVRSEERYDYKDQRTVTLNDFDRSDRTYDDDEEDYDSGSVIEAVANFAPQNGAVQLSEQGSRELVTSVSWISENYDF